MTSAHSLLGHPPSNIPDREQCPAWVARIMAGETEGAPQRGSATQQELVANAKRYISRLAGMRIRLTDVGRALHVSPVYVTEVFHQVEGMPLYRYALRQRLEHAVRLLPGYQGSFSELALELDFANHSHFTTAFRRAFGCTPAAFREKARRVCGNFTSSASQRVETQNPSVAEHLARPVSA